MKDPKCRESAYRFLTAYNWLDEVGDKMKGAPIFGVDIAFLMETLDTVSEQMDTLFKDGRLNQPELTELRVAIQDVKGHLPAVEGKYLRAHESERLAQSERDNEKLMNRLAEVMFESVSECECKVSPESMGYHGGGRIDRLPR